MSLPSHHESSRVTHVIFDLDGLLLDTETQFIRSIKSVLNCRFGRELTAALEQKITGMWLKASAPLLVSELSLPITGNELFNAVSEDFLNNINNIQLMRGSERIVKYFAANHIPMAICTGRSSLTFPKVTKHLGDFFNIGKYFNHIVTADDDKEIIRNKPHPDPYLVCAKRFNTAPQSSDNVLVFEDSPIGVKSAISAKMKCVLVTDPRLPSNNCLDTDLLNNVQMVIQSLDDFKPQLFHLPTNF